MAVDSQAILTMLRHETRREILRDMLGRDEAVSPKELAKRIATPLSNVSYHIRVMDKLEMVRLADTEPVRGSLKHFYRLSKGVEDSKLVRDVLSLGD